MGTPKRGRPVYRFLPIKITKHESSRNIIISSETSQYKIFFCWHRTIKIPPFLLLLVNTIIIVNNKLLYRGRKNFVIVSSPWNCAIFFGRPTFLLAPLIIFVLDFNLRFLFLTIVFSLKMSSSLRCVFQTKLQLKCLFF